MADKKFEVVLRRGCKVMLNTEFGGKVLCLYMIPQTGSASHGALPWRPRVEKDTEVT